MSSSFDTEAPTEVVLSSMQTLDAVVGSACIYSSEQNMRARAALAAATAEDLLLLRPRGKGTGYKGVSYVPATHPSKPFKSTGPGHEYLGYYHTAEEAALSFARHVGRAALLDMQETDVKLKSVPMSAAEVRRVAADEGLELLESPENASGYTHVMKHTESCIARPYYVNLRTGPAGYLGSYAVPEEAALAYARHLGQGWFKARAAAAAQKAAQKVAQEAERAEKAKQRQDVKEAVAKRKAEQAQQRASSKQAKKEAMQRCAAECAAMEAELHERQQQQNDGEYQKRLLQEAALAQRQRQSSCGGGTAAPAANAAATASGASGVPSPFVDADGPFEELVAMVLAGAAPAVDPWRCLGLQPATGREQCRKRYLAIILRLRPDKCNHPQADEAFKRVEHAWRRIQGACE